jgi:gas vesicle protein
MNPRKEKNKMAADDCVKGLIVGGLIGAALGILYAPKSGKEMRKEIINSTEELLDKAKEQYEEACKKIEKLARREEELVIGQKERLKKSIEAGVEAFKQVKTAAPGA